MKRRKITLENNKRGIFSGVLNDFEIHLNENKEAVVEGYEGLLELSPEKIRISCKGAFITFIGKDLLVDFLALDGCVVKGVIDEVLLAGMER